MKTLPIGLPNLRKLEWNNISPTDTRRLFKDFKIEHPKLGELTISSRPVPLEFGTDRIMIEVHNAYKKLLGNELIFMNHQNKDMLGINILVNPDYRQKNLRIGELLRIFSILEMAENKSSVFGIFTKDSAVYFHSKYKFLPNNKNFKYLNPILEKIANDTADGFDTFVKRANILLNAIKNTSSPEEAYRLTQETNKLIQEYICAAHQSKKPQFSHPFSQGFDMEITIEQLEQNKEFYNNLFRKYGIDYEI